MKSLVLRMACLLFMLPAPGVAQEKVELNTITRVEAKGVFIEITGTKKPSFTTFTLAASSLLSLLHLAQDTLNKVAIAMLLLVAATLVVPKAGELLERPFLFLTRRRGGDVGGGFLLGASLGLVFVPCAGPVLIFDPVPGTVLP